MKHISVLIIADKDVLAKEAQKIMSSFDEDIDCLYLGLDNPNIAYYNIHWDNIIIINKCIENIDSLFKVPQGKIIHIEFNNFVKERKTLFNIYLQDILDKQMLGCDSCRADCD